MTTIRPSAARRSTATSSRRRDGDAPGNKPAQDTRTDAKAIAHLFATVSLGAPEKAVGFVLWRVLHRYVREVDRALSGLDLTHLQFQTLALAAWLCRAGESATQSDIARTGDIQKMQVSHMLRTLEDKGLITRPRSSSDVRANHVEVTAAGLARLRQALPKVIDVQRRRFGDDGMPGGSLLNTLLRLDEKRPEG
jgi:MarR family transcriptional regulator, organic hydroperoxide resistance regulator